MGPEDMAATMPYCCKGAELLQKERGHLEVDVFFSFPFFCIFHQSFINYRQNPWGKTSQQTACCKYSRKQEAGKREGRLNLVAFIFNKGYFNLF